MTKNETALDAGLLSTFLDLDPETGFLYWKARNASRFQDTASLKAEARAKLWNGRYAGARAFTAKHRGMYFVGAINGVNFFAHRVVFAIHHGHWPQYSIDHIDGNGLNNRPENLRDVSHCENMRNVKMHQDNSTGFIGVSFSKSIQKFEARIHVDGRPRVIGYYETPEAAGDARRAAGASHGFHENHGRRAA